MADDTPESHLQILKAMLQVLTQLLDAHNIRHWADGGTLLGSIRGGDIIPWDDDVDISIFYKDMHSVAFQDLLDKFSSVTFALAIDDDTTENHKIHFQRSDNFLVKIFIPDLWLKTPSGRLIGTPTIDIFAYEQHKNTIRLSSLTHRRLYPNCFHNKKDLFPLKKSKFGEFEINVPQNPLPFLFRYYGKGCLVRFVRDERREDAPLHKK
jgi:phosphorylcholine metabolism protein LicD